MQKSRHVIYVITTGNVADINCSNHWFAVGGTFLQLLYPSEFNSMAGITEISTDLMCNITAYKMALILIM